MATKIVCDRCGEEINPRDSLTQIRVTHNGYTTYRELCVSCGFWLNKYLKNEVLIERSDTDIMREKPENG